jgi:predicted alpha/beta superfamily hydrolase
MKWRRRARTAAGALACVWSSQLVAQDPPARSPVSLPRTEIRYLSSRAVGQRYKLYVSLPQRYADTSRRFSVVFLLDADYSFALAHNIVEHLSDRHDLDELLLVGIAYAGPLRYRLNRTRDYTPTHVPTGGYGPAYQRVSGGGPNFRRFLKEELIPFIEQRYRVRHDRTLVGHSYGGLFASWVAFTDPELFQRYIIVSPSLWYDDHLMFDVEAQYAAGHTRLPTRIFFTVGAREVNAQRDMVADLRRFVAQIDAHGYHDLGLRWRVLPEDTHDSVFPTGLGLGLRYVFDGR